MCSRAHSLSNAHYLHVQKNDLGSINSHWVMLHVRYIHSFFLIWRCGLYREWVWSSHNLSVSQGHDTTSAGMCWALFLLGLHPDIQVSFNGLVSLFWQCYSSYLKIVDILDRERHMRSRSASSRVLTDLLHWRTSITCITLKESSRSRWDCIPVFRLLQGISAKMLR